MTALRILQLLVVFNALFLIAQAIRVIALYSAVYAVTPGPRRLLPLHVWLVATSYLLFLVGTSFLLVVDPSFHAVIRVVLYGAAGILGQYALWNLLKYERRKYSKVNNFGLDEKD